ncbi:MAG: aldehyde dehydrogenase family protein [Geminicoccaceae bacterium]
MGKTLKLISPIDGSIYAERAVADRGVVEERLRLARDAQRDWANEPLDVRVKIVRAAIAALRDNNEKIVQEIAWSMGRPVRYGGEIGGVEERAYHMADIASEALAPIVVEESDAFHRYISKEPAGLVFVMAPWNYPYLTAVNTIAPALIAGNAVVLKHATQTLITGERFAEAFTKAGLPEAVFTNLFLDHQTTEKLLAAGQFDHVNFTGSVGGGRTIERAAAGTFTSIGLELGGKDPGYVMEDADLDAAVDTLIDGAMFNSGQCCCGIERIYVADALYNKFVDKAVAIVEGYKLGNPLEEATTLGPMAHRRFADEVRAQISEATAAGARPLIDASLFPEDDSGTYLAPQILVDVDHTQRVMRDESFGPVVGIMKVKNDDEAVSLMNDSDFGLTASLWTKDTDRAASIGNRIQTGTVFMNRCDYLDPALCWTGCKDTGKGGALSVIGYHNLTRPKSYHLKKV